jgi:hypothetical protein
MRARCRFWHTADVRETGQNVQSARSRRLTDSALDPREWNSGTAGHAGRAAATAVSAGPALLLVVAKAQGWGLSAGLAGPAMGLLTLLAATLTARIYANGQTATAPRRVGRGAHLRDPARARAGGFDSVPPQALSPPRPSRR